VAAAHEMMDLSQRVEAALREVYRPDGINLGMNIGQAAGAGVPVTSTCISCRAGADLELHDWWLANPLLPETLDTTWERLKAALVVQHEHVRPRCLRVVYAVIRPSH